MGGALGILLLLPTFAASVLAGSGGDEDEGAGPAGPPAARTEPVGGGPGADEEDDDSDDSSDSDTSDTSDTSHTSDTSDSDDSDTSESTDSSSDDADDDLPPGTGG